MDLYAVVCAKGVTGPLLLCRLFGGNRKCTLHIFEMGFVGKECRGALENRFLKWQCADCALDVFGGFAKKRCLLSKHLLQPRDAKGWKVSGNFGNFQFRPFFNILWDCLYKNQQNWIYPALIPTHLFWTTFLAFYWFVWVYRENHKALLYGIR